MKRIMIIAVTAIALLSNSLYAQSLDQGIKMVRYERYNTAKSVLQPLAASDPIANYYLGLAELGSQNTNGARAIFSKYPNDPANMAGMARLAFASGNSAEGMRLAQAVVGMAKKKDVQPYVFAADAINYGGGDKQSPANITTAIDYYKKALEKTDNVDIRIGIADAYQKLQGGGGNAMTNYEDAVAKDPKNSLGYSRIGKLWYDAHNYPSALINFQKAKEADPTNPLPYRDLANAYFQSGKYELAKQNIEEYLKLSDQTCDDKISYANILYLAKYYPEAISKMQEVLGSCGERPYMYRVLGQSQYETKDYTNSVQNMRTLFAKSDPAMLLPRDYLTMGKLMIQLKHPDSTEIYFNKAFTLDTTSAMKTENYRDLGELYKAQNTDAGYAKAADYYGKAVQSSKDPSNTDYFWWGTMSYYAKRYSEANRIFGELEQKYPSEASYTYWRARVLSAVDSEGKTGAAIPVYDKWLAAVGPNYDRKTDLVTAYRYYAIYYYNKGEKSKMNEYIKKITDINPNDALAKQLTGLSKQTGGAPAKATPPKSGTKPKGK
jgi:tetratricopeptide (TPR) repeat protein